MWNGLWERYKGTIAGFACGIILGIVYLFFGFWDMLVFAFLAAVGGHIGFKIDRGEEVFPVEQISRWFNEKWNLFR